jgi:hypothetical protein
MKPDKSRIQEGDIVSVNFNNAQATLCVRARVDYTPCATGDSWIFTDMDTNEIHYVSEGCTITKRANNTLCVKTEKEADNE